jgi:hypothetical protein
LGDKVNLAEKLALFDDVFRPRIVGHLNDYELAGTVNTGDAAPGELTAPDQEL